MKASVLERRCAEMRERKHEEPRRLRKRVARLEKRLESMNNRLAYVRRKLRAAEHWLGYEIQDVQHISRGCCGAVMDALEMLPVGRAVQVPAHKTKHFNANLHEAAKHRGWKIRMRTMGDLVVVVRRS